MKPDFSGWATKANLKCSDGRTIMPNAFEHQDQMQVPLVWMHGHSDPENVLGHAILTNRPEGVWIDAYFNNTPKGQHTKEAVQHKDIKALSIWANGLLQKAKNVIHGSIREVSLVLSGANPGALIETVTIHHSATDTDEELEDEVIIHTGEEIVVDTVDPDEKPEEANTKTGAAESKNEGETEPKKEEGDAELEPALAHAANNDELTVEDVYNTMNDQQKNVLHYMIGEALRAAGNDDEMGQSAIQHGENDTPEQIIETMDDAQKNALQYMVGQAIEHARQEAMAQSGTNDSNQEGNNQMTTTNLFEKDADKVGSASVLSHADQLAILEHAKKNKASLKETLESFVESESELVHGITDIDIMFPDAKALADSPEIYKRRTEWVEELLNSVRKSPFSRIKSLSADLTFEDARAKGYVKGTLKKEEFFGVTKRVTTPTTIYKKQKLDRDDIIDITDFDVVVWLKAEMRLMLNEEVARAILIGDGREVGDDDKIKEENIRPIAKDHELYVTTVNVNLDDANSSGLELIDRIVENRKYYRGTGTPNMYTSETYISMLMMVRDTTTRRIYRSLDEVAAELRVQKIIPVEVMEDEPDLVAIIVNPIDYVVGADKGGSVAMFDDFDIDYNQYKYLIETRMSGCLIKLKSAIVVRKVAAAAVEVAPAAPTFNAATGVTTIPTVTGVVYKNEDTDATLTAGAQTALAPGATLNVIAVPASSSYFFATSEDDQWSFTRNA